MLGQAQDWDFNTFAGPGNFEWDIAGPRLWPGGGGRLAAEAMYECGLGLGPPYFLNQQERKEELRLERAMGTPGERQ